MTSTQDARQPATGQAFAWDAHPARERVAHAVAAGVAVFALGALSATLMRSSWWGIVAVAFLVAALNRFFFPSRFSLDAEGVTAEHPLRRQRLPWADVRRFAEGAHGAFLGSQPAPSWLDGRRGVHLLFGTRRDEVLREVRARLPEGVAS